jgi:hypothetical protein
VKSVALWSANIRKLAKDHKSYGSAANVLTAWVIVNLIFSLFSSHCAIVEKYLLEKSRIVSQAKNERFVFTVY